mmetsp:Transcript_19225/g.55155  ORF Transcript_19225/g.55155 Transcript_19225/m.55155 type:complete len:268 (-) Transcript_19225:1751-2554(-)
MGTSFAPSPTDNVTGVGFTFSRTSRTICAFCKGDTRQAITMEQDVAKSKNSALLEASEKMCSNAGPVTMIALKSRLKLPNFVRPLVSSSRILSPSASGGLSTSTIVMDSSSTFELKPMLRAVSSLSPVRTHKLMPALRSISIVLGTSSWSLSSMAVAPAISRFFSIPSAAAASSPARSPRDFAAASYLVFHALASLAGNSRRPISKVRRPWFAKVFNASSNTISFLLARSIITLSAPFTNKKYLPSRSTTTDCLFRVESKAFTACTV